MPSKTISLRPEAYERRGPFFCEESLDRIEEAKEFERAPVDKWAELRARRRCPAGELRTPGMRR